MLRQYISRRFIPRRSQCRWEFFVLRDHGVENCSGECGCRETLEKLNDAEMTFYPLLLPDSASLTDRTGSLSSWCQGFIDGVGLAIAQKNVPIDSAGQDIIGEIIEDFSQISKLTSASVMNQDGEELAYMEVVEYVRVGVQLIFEEMRVAKT